MAKITPKDNFMKLVRGGHPEYVPYFTMMGEGYMGEVADVMVMPDCFGDTSFLDGGTDMWGVPYKGTEGTATATMPDTRVQILEDIDDWRDVLKYPSVPRPDEIDWEAVYQRGLAAQNVDRTRTAVKTGPLLSPFMELVGMMGFTEGLMALITEPEECLAMFHAMTDFLEPYINKYIDIYKPDLWYMLDDTCAKETPFFSPEIYRQVFRPIYERLAKPAIDRGIPIIFHICGMYEPFLADMVDWGVTIVEPTQESNDILKMKETYKGRLGIIGGWDWGCRIPSAYPEFDEEELRQGVRDTIDRYAPGGGYGFFSWPISYAGDPVLPEVKRIIRDEAHWYGRKVYGYHED